MKSMKVVVYSCISGGYDEKKPDRLYIPPCDRFRSHRLNAKIPKILSHKFVKDADYTIWADSNLVFKIDPISLVEYFNYPKVGTFSNITTTIDQEIQANLEWGFDHPDRLEYHRGKPGRVACCFLIVRRNADDVNRLNEAWWAEICAGSSRDQLSFPYTLGTIATYKNLPNNNFDNNRMWKRLPHFSKNPKLL